MFYGAGIGRDCFTGNPTWYAINETVEVVRLAGPICEKCNQADSSDNLPRLLFTGKKVFHFPSEVVGADDKWLSICPECYDTAI